MRQAAPPARPDYAESEDTKRRALADAAKEILAAERLGIVINPDHCSSRLASEQEQLERVAGIETITELVERFGSRTVQAWVRNVAALKGEALG